MAMASVTVRVDEGTKRRASAISGDLGLGLSRSPLPAETVDTSVEARRIAASGSARFDTTGDMFATLGI